ncbi:hypothetical protein [Pyxidicoccus sp. MSG2]|uniref:hypothetical protein n=1 Tax=Pyxidicoccus sp. MSG2 TaxID=2996790 RepID=UPI00226F265B|nr:hypothetical protein [Pyxidicoccus sp. MSG2]MCY1015805.1 hypothetical protein [Pyxidicoccus sp. MSG2]
MKNVFVAVAVMFSVSLLGCGGPEAELQSEEPTPATEEVTASATPACSDVDTTACATQGAVTYCTLLGGSGRRFACVCDGTQWVCV